LVGYASKIKNQSLKSSWFRVLGKTMRRERQFGFTLIELGVTLMVLAILTMLAAPSFSDLIEKSRLRGATDDIANLLNISRADAVRLGLAVDVSVQGSGSDWCAGAVSAANPQSDDGTIGQPAVTLSVAACDCASSAACVVAGKDTHVSSGSYTGVTLSKVGSTIAYSSGSGGVVFNPKVGALNPSSLPADANPVIVLNSKSGKYSTHIDLSMLGQTLVCVPDSSPFVAGYPTCAAGQ
jgi:type IV fimbrial biogenesis protein FimT